MLSPVRLNELETNLLYGRYSHILSGSFGQNWLPEAHYKT